MIDSRQASRERPPPMRGRAFSVGMAYLLSAASLHAQSTEQSIELPFGVGERLRYTVSAGKLGSIGEGVMSVDGPVDVRGTATLVLRSNVHARVGFVKSSERAESWIDPMRMVALRYSKRARGPFSRGDERVELYPNDQRWEDRRGRVGESPTSQPLDELSFIYYLRTLPLSAGTADSVVRHYDRDRNPIVVRVIGRDTIRTKAGTFATVSVEMRVKDRERYGGGGEGVIRIHFSDDANRYPVRIESSVPVLGRMVLSLASVDGPAARLASRPDRARGSGEP